MVDRFRLIVFILVMLPWSAVMAEPESNRSSAGGDISVVEAFAEQQAEEGEAVKISDRRKHLWLFVMGVTLLVLILFTAVLGIMMGIYGKDVFIAHMLFAGLTVTLAIAHAVAALVWFNPFI